MVESLKHELFLKHNLDSFLPEPSLKTRPGSSHSRQVYKSSRTSFQSESQVLEGNSESHHKINVRSGRVSGCRTLKWRSRISFQSCDDSVSFSWDHVLSIWRPNSWMYEVFVCAATSWPSILPGHNLKTWDPKAKTFWFSLSSTSCMLPMSLMRRSTPPWWLRGRFRRGRSEQWVSSTSHTDVREGKPPLLGSV